MHVLCLIGIVQKLAVGDRRQVTYCSVWTLRSGTLSSVLWLAQCPSLATQPTGSILSLVPCIAVQHGAAVWEYWGVMRSPKDANFFENWMEIESWMLRC